MTLFLKSIQGKFRLGWSSWIWRRGGRQRYFKEEPILKFPDPSRAPGPVIYQKMQELYERGYTVLDTEQYRKLAQAALSQFREEFQEPIRIYDDPNAGDRRIVRVDDRGWYWSGGTTSGVIRLIFEDRSHPDYRAVFGEDHAREMENKGVATVQDLCAPYPWMRELLEDKALCAMAAYANGGDTRPMAVQIERKTHSRKEAYNFLHFDTLSSTFKSYLYLTDVGEGTGPVSISPGSHHWKRYPLLLEDVMARKRSRFTLEDLERYGAAPLEPVNGSAGSLFCFTPNALHTATQVEPGRERWSIHLYYYSTRPYVSDAV